jgi:hypothetical protein
VDSSRRLELLHRERPCRQGHDVRVVSALIELSAKPARAWRGRVNRTPRRVPCAGPLSAP